MTSAPKPDPYADLAEVYEEEANRLQPDVVVTRRMPNPDRLDYETPTTRGGRTV